MRRLIPGLAVVATALAVAAPAARADVSVQYFTLPPELKGITNGLDVSPAGTVYFGSGDGFEATPPIGRLNPALAVPGTPTGITWVTTPDGPGCCASIFRDFSWSTLDNRLYWSRSDRLVGTVQGDVVSSGLVPVAPWGIVAAPDGGAWVTEYGSSNVQPDYIGNRIARVGSDLSLGEWPNLAMQTGTFDGTRYDAKPKGIAVTPAGKPWFVEAEAGNPGYRIGTTGSGTGYVEYRPCETRRALLRRVLRDRADRCGRGRGRHGLVHERAQEDDRALHPRYGRVRRVPAAGRRSRAFLRHAAGDPRRARRGAVGRGRRRLLLAGRQRAVAGRPRGLAGGDDLQARRGAAAVRGRRRAQRGGLVHGLARDGRWADRPADDERRPGPGPDADSQPRRRHPRRRRPRRLAGTRTPIRSSRAPAEAART